MAAPRQRAIIKVCIHVFLIQQHLTGIHSQIFRKYSHSLGPEALEFLEEILERHDVADEDVEFSIELIAKEYNKQDGEYSFRL